MQKTIIILTILLVSAACSNFHMEKRRYNKGFHVTFNKNRVGKKSATNEPSLAKSERKSRKSSKLRSPSNSNKPLETLDVDVKTEYLSHRPSIHPPSKLESTPETSVASIDSAKAFASERTSTEIATSRTSSKPASSPGINGLWYFTLLGILPLFLVIKGASRSIAIWASENVSKAQAAIVGLYGLGFTSSFLLGNMWQPNIAEWMLGIPIALAGSILVADAVKKKGKSSFIRKRMSFAALNTSSFFATFALGAQSKFSVLQAIDPEPNTGLDPVVASIATVFVILLMLVALLGIALLSCTVACSGYGLVVGLLVMSGGSFLVVFLGIWGVLGIKRGSSRNSDNIRTALIAGSAVALFCLITAAISAVL
ncbi:MAG: hypothetical protein AB8B56_14315 [Crocinitomicaceae bacterium]